MASTIQLEGEFVASAKFEGKRRNYLFKIGELGLGYYRNDTTVTEIGRIGEALAAQLAGDRAVDEDEEERGVVLELPMPAPNEYEVTMDELQPVSEDELNSSTQSNLRLLNLSKEGKQFCKYRLPVTQAGPHGSALLSVIPPTDFDNAECCPVMAHARIAVVPEMEALDILTLTNIREPRVLWRVKPFNEENERLALKWLRRQIYVQLRQMGTFIPPPPPLLGGSQRVKLASKTINPATERTVGTTDTAALNSHRLSVAPEVFEAQRALLDLLAKLELATARTLVESRVDRSGCVAAPLPLGAPIHGKDAAILVVGGASLRRGSSEIIDLDQQQGGAWRPAASSPPTGCSSAAVAIAPCFSPKGKRLARPIVLAIGGQCGSRLSSSVHAFDSSADGAGAADAWSTVRVPRLPQATSCSGAGLVVPRGWAW